MKKLIVILGMYKSGTSLLAQLCKSMGAYLGNKNDLVSDVESLLDDYLGNRRIIQLNENILHYCGYEYHNLEMLNPDYNHPQVKKVMEKMKALIQELLEKSDIVAIKDSRIPLLLPLWDKILKGYDIKIQYLWVFRNPLDVAESLRTESGESSNYSFLLWIYYNLSILKFLKDKEYMQINYDEIPENPKIFEDIGQLFGSKLDANLEWEINNIIKQKYCYPNYPNQNFTKELVLDLYGILIEGKERKVDLSELEKQYTSIIQNNKKCKCLDYEILEGIKCLKDKNIIIYGAGDYGKQAVKMLTQLGVCQYIFCDKDVHKQGKTFMGGKIYSIKEIEHLKNPLIIVAICDPIVQKKVTQSLSCLDNVSFLSFFALKKVWKYFVYDYTTIEHNLESLSLWYDCLRVNSNLIMTACESPIIVYQYGKVGSTTISKSLQNIGIEHGDLHRFFDGNDITGKLILGDERAEFIKNSNVFRLHSSEYVKCIKEKIKNKKIITLIRDPIAVDLARVFQWIGSGVADRYIADQMRHGKSFLQSVSNLTVEMQDFLFEWFDKELKIVCNIDVLDYPFDKEKGYTIIKENTVEILLIKTEKLSEMTEILRAFIHNQELTLINANIGKEKKYAYMYEQTKKKIKLPKEYVEHYYNNNPYMDHFYTKEEQEMFYNKWNHCI